MSTAAQYETIKQQCKAFEWAGYPATFKTPPFLRKSEPCVKIEGFLKQWHFSDPSWDVVISQLATLWKNEVKTKKKCKND